MRMLVMRIVIVITLALGINYVVWRWMFSLNFDAWWIAIPLVLAETYSLIDVCLFGMTVWRSRSRPPPPRPAEGATVDVLITSYNEPVEMVMETALAAQAIRHPHNTWILDDGSRPELRAAAEDAGVGYITRGDEWIGQPRHAKAGNVNNALMQTSGAYILILDADQIPRPQILDNTLGYFTDDRVALVQTPQVFKNVPLTDPLGSQAPLFYGPIQQGKDGWNAAFFCGSNAILRRDALMQLGIIDYVKELDGSIRATLRTAARVVRQARAHDTDGQPAVREALSHVYDAIAHARSRLRKGDHYAEITYDLQRQVDTAALSIVTSDLVELQSDLAEIRELAAVTSGDGAPDIEHFLNLESTIAALATREMSPLNALETVQAVLRAIDIDRADEAQPVMPLATISVTEDMATSMRLHGLGWKSVYHHETLADGLAPEDVGTMLTQRLRWAQGTMQVLLRENPLLQRRLGWPQRLMYFATMWSYLSGFAAVVYLAAPIVFLVFGILPVSTLAFDFFIRFIPFMIANQLLFLVVARGIPTWRGQQYSLALFPVWIEACRTAFNNVVLRIPLGFAVTPKTRPVSTGPQWHLIKTQIIVAVMLVMAILIGCVRLFLDGAEPIGTVVNIFWAVYDLIVLGILITAARYTGHYVTETDA